MGDELIGIGQRLKDERKRLNLMQEDIARIMNVAKISVSRYEAGRSIPTEALARLQEYGIDVAYILTGEYSQRLNSDESYILSLWRKLDGRTQHGVRSMIEIFLNKDEIKKGGENDDF